MTPVLAALPLGAALDALIGDPPGWPHPVRAIGWLIARTERALRRLLARIGGGPRAETLAGAALAALVVGLAGATAWGVLAACDRAGGPWPLIGRALMVFWGLATRGLRDEPLRASEAPDLESARFALSRIVGRDTEALDRPEIARACVETIGENTCDGVVAPLFWYAAGGPIALWMYKAINTLDSMVGHLDDRYRRLGWASARLDDAANLLPARLSWLLIALAALVLGERPLAALRIGWRDGREHPSPNSAWGQAALAGALGVRLGGPSTYRGVPRPKPLLGEPREPIGPGTVRRAARVMTVASWSAVGMAWLVRAGLLGLA